MRQCGLELSASRGSRFPEKQGCEKEHTSTVLDGIGQFVPSRPQTCSEFTKPMLEATHSLSMLKGKSSDRRKVRHVNESCVLHRLVRLLFQKTRRRCTRDTQPFRRKWQCGQDTLSTAIARRACFILNPVLAGVTMLRLPAAKGVKKFVLEFYGFEFLLFHTATNAVLQKTVDKMHSQLT